MWPFKSKEKPPISDIEAYKLAMQYAFDAKRNGNANGTTRGFYKNFNAERDLIFDGPDITVINRITGYNADGGPIYSVFTLNRRTLRMCEGRHDHAASSSGDNKTPRLRPRGKIRKR